MVTLSVSESSASFRFEPNTSYRLRLDGVDMETAKSVIIWKVGGDAVHAYEPTKRCQEQGVAVHANGADLILIEVNATQVVGHVIEAFTGRHRFRIHFLVDRKEGESISDHRIAIQIAGIIGGGGSLLLAAITIIHNYKCRERPKITEKSRGKNEGPSRKTIRALRKHFKGRALTPTTHAKQEAQAIPI
ncbi:hypothetical protein ANCCAN_03532 [Ancylostoma caninum]|uniref:Uncharacterized protein n=1 Tax=Ancylostoma caninum TaxID=29170 RepID=A0A368H4U3_ANCCA|nr:hypothetical protein ANCCAN_03532 [Ancylostoma caninum]